MSIVSFPIETSHFVPRRTVMFFIFDNPSGKTLQFPIPTYGKTRLLLSVFRHFSSSVATLEFCCDVTPLQECVGLLASDEVHHRHGLPLSPDGLRVCSRISTDSDANPGCGYGIHLNEFCVAWLFSNKRKGDKPKPAAHDEKDWIV